MRRSRCVGINGYVGINGSCECVGINGCVVVSESTDASESTDPSNASESTDASESSESRKIRRIGVNPGFLFSVEFRGNIYDSNEKDELQIKVSYIRVAA